MADEAEIQRMVYRIIGDGSSYTKMARDVAKATTDMVKPVADSTAHVGKLGEAIDRVGNKVSGLVGSMRAITALESPVGFVRDSVALAGRQEQSEISFGTMLQDMSKGKQLIADITELAAKTPMSLEGLQRGAQTLLQFGTKGSQIIPYLKMIGDVVGGDEEKLRSMTLAFGQMTATGRLMGGELLQMINAGFNPLEEMTRTTGKSMVQLKAEMEAGRITVNMVKEAFRTATSAGGRFNGLMEAQSQSLLGLFSTLKDDIAAAKRTVGQFVVESFRLKDVLRAGSKAAQEFTQWFKSLDPQVKKAVVTAALAVAAFGSLVVTWRVVVAMGSILHGSWMNLATAMGIVVTRTLQAARGLVSLLNPITLVSSALRVLRVLVTTVFGPWGLALMAATVLVSALVERYGGLEAAMSALGDLAKAVWDAVSAGALAAWDAVQAAATRFWTWFKPYWETMKATALKVWDEVMRLGGMAWEYVSTKAGEAFDWITAQVEALVAFLTPVFRALESLATEVWAQISGRGSQAWDWVKEQAQFVWDVMKVLGDNLMHFFNDVWRSIGGSGLVTWTEIRDAAAMAIYTVEFGIKNFGRVWDLAITGAALSAVKLFNKVEYFFTTVLPAAFSWFARNWDKVFIDAFKLGGTVAENLFQNIADIFDNLDEILFGDKTIQDYWKPLTRGFNPTVEPLVIPPRVPGEVERALQAEFDAGMGGLAEDWVAFLARKMAEAPPVVTPELVLPPAVVTEVETRAEEVGETVARAMAKPADRFDAALRNSAEAMGRIQAFKDGNRANPENRGTDWRAQQQERAEATRLARETLRSQERVRRAVEAGNNRPQFNIAPADIVV